MAHHGSDPFESEDPNGQERRKHLKELLNTTSFRGALGEFPEGQLNQADEGAIQFGVAVDRGKVVLDFGKTVAWIGMTPQQAADLASCLVKRAREAARATGEPITFTVL